MTEKERVNQLLLGIERLEDEQKQLFKERDRLLKEKALLLGMVIIEESQTQKTKQNS